MPTSVPAELLEGRKLHSKVAPSLSDAGREEEQAVASPSLLRHVGWRRSAALHQRWVKWIPGFFREAAFVRAELPYGVTLPLGFEARLPGARVGARVGPPGPG
jgi:hypothetical protein